MRHSQGEVTAAAGILVGIPAADTSEAALTSEAAALAAVTWAVVPLGVNPAVSPMRVISVVVATQVAALVTESVLTLELVATSARVTMAVIPAHWPRIHRSEPSVRVATVGSRLLGLARWVMGMDCWPLVGHATVSRLGLDCTPMDLGRNPMGLARRLLDSGLVCCLLAARGPSTPLRRASSRPSEPSTVATKLTQRSSSFDNVEMPRHFVGCVACSLSATHDRP